MISCLFYVNPDVTHDMETAICVHMRGQVQELDAEGSSESEMYANPLNKRGGIQVPPTSAWDCAS